TTASLWRSTRSAKAWRSPSRTRAINSASLDGSRTMGRLISSLASPDHHNADGGKRFPRPWRTALSSSGRPAAVRREAGRGHSSYPAEEVDERHDLDAGRQGPSEDRLPRSELHGGLGQEQPDRQQRQGARRASA